MRFALSLATLSAVLACAAVGAQELPAPLEDGRPGVILEWPRVPQRGGYRIGALVLTMRNDVSGEDSEILERVLRIDAPGLPTFGISAGDDSFGPSVMAVETPSGDPMVLFQTYSGGAHCCTTIQAIQPRDGRFEAVEVYRGDGGPIEEAPRDIDGDGTIDIVRYDNRFLYRFASYADSFAPPVVVNVVEGEAVDVSDRAGFGALFEEERERARSRCVGAEEGTRNGACASYVAAAARLGRFHEAWSEMLANFDRESDWGLEGDCRVTPVDGQCPDGQETSFADYPEALRAFLIEAGYLER